MKKNIIITIIIVMALQVISTNGMADETNAICEARDFVEQIMDAYPWARSSEARYFVDGGFHWRALPEFAQLEQVVSGNPEEILGNILEIAPSEIHQIILSSSFFSLSQKDVFQCLDKIADLCLDNAIGKDVFWGTMILYTVHTPKGKKALAVNYQGPVVSGMLRMARTFDPEREYYAWFASGEAQRELTSLWYYDDVTNTHPNLNRAKERLTRFWRDIAKKDQSATSQPAVAD